MSSRARAITGCILAGGRGQRLGGVDKGLLELGGRPLVAHVLAALRPQVDDVVISANRNQARYRALWKRVVADDTAAFDGPLAGIAAAMAVSDTPLLATAPCDSPFLPSDLVARLLQGMEMERCEIAVASAGGRLQPVFALLETSLLASLRAALGRGERKIARWYGEHRMVQVDFGDTAAAFANINTPEEFAAAEALLTHP